MPALRLDEVRLPELHLPEMSRDEIVRALSEARPTLDLTRLDPRRSDGPDVPKLDVPRIDIPRIDLAKVELPQLDLARIDLPKAIAAAAQTAGLFRKPRARWPIVIGVLVAVVVAGAVVLTSPRVKPRLAEAARRWRERMESRRDETAIDAMERTAREAVAVPVEPTAFDDTPSPAPTQRIDEPATI